MLVPTYQTERKYNTAKWSESVKICKRCICCTLTKRFEIYLFITWTHFPAKIPPKLHRNKPNRIFRHLARIGTNRNKWCGVSIRISALRVLRVKICAESALWDGYLLEKKYPCRSVGNSAVRKTIIYINFLLNMNRYKIKFWKIRVCYEIFLRFCDTIQPALKINEYSIQIRDRLSIVELM